MATAALLCSEYLRCPVCLDLFREPVTIPCGHSFCLGCITRCWAPGAAHTTCPQCRCCFRSDSPPRLCKNSILAQMVEDFSPLQGSREGVSGDTNLARGIKELVESGHHRTSTPEEDPLMEDSSTPTMLRSRTEFTSFLASGLEHRQKVTQGFSDMVNILEVSGFRLLQLIDQTQSRVLERTGSQEWEPGESQPADEGLTMVITPGGDQDQSTQVVPSEIYHQIKTEEELPWDRLSVAMSEFKACMMELCGDHMRRMAQQVQSSTCSSLPSELWRSPLQPLIPRSRDEFLQYSREISLDPDTAHRNLCLMQGNHRVLCKLQPQNYPDHHRRFDHYTQVLGREALSKGRHYWEVHLSGSRVSLGVSYHGIARKGHESHCLVGRNSQSWCLEWTSTRCCAWHDGQKVLVATGHKKSLGVFLDWDNGSLSFHELSDSMPILHRFQTSFIQPVCPIFFVSWNSIVSIGESPRASNYPQNKHFHRQLSANF